MNTGHSNAPNTTGTLTSTSQYVTITNSTYNFNTLNKGGNANSVFSVNISSSLPDTAIIVFNYTLQSGQYIKQNTYILTAGVAMEDFETGDFLKFDWVQSGNAPWTITLIDPYEGVYSAKSGLITNDQTSELQISMQVSLPDTISFWKKVSCEKGSNWGGTYYWYDHMEFLIDGVSLGRWDGIDANWSKAEYPVGTGTHTFSWVYKKDGSVSEGDDCAWLDFIVFPPSIKIIQGMENASTEIPMVFTCAPNPTSGLSRINFNLNKSSIASLTLHDIAGKVMAKIIDQEIKNEGDHVVLVNFVRYSPGIYFLNLSYDNIIKTEKIVIIK
jgi:hypothetical protein